MPAHAGADDDLRRRAGLRPDAASRRARLLHANVRHRRSRPNMGIDPRVVHPGFAVALATAASCAGCTGGWAAARRSSCGARTARSSTSSSTLARSRRRSADTRRSASMTSCSGTCTFLLACCTASRYSAKPRRLLPDRPPSRSHRGRLGALRRLRPRDRLARAGDHDQRPGSRRRILGRRCAQALTRRLTRQSATAASGRD